MMTIIQKLTKKIHKNFKTGKPFPKSTQKHMRKSDVRHYKMQQDGYKGPTYQLNGKKRNGSHLLDEIWIYNPYTKK